jgi:hypothetical protein
MKRQKRFGTARLETRKMVKVVADKITTAHKKQDEQSKRRTGAKIVRGSLLTTSFGKASLKTRMDVEISCDGKQKPGTVEKEK